MMKSGCNMMKSGCNMMKSGSHKGLPISQLNEKKTKVFHINNKRTQIHPGPLQKYTDAVDKLIQDIS